MILYLIDTSALLALRDDEPGAERVAELLRRSGQGEARCLGCFISLMEVMYRVWRDEDETAGRLAYAQCLSLPMEWIHESGNLLKKAAEVKATWRMSVADAWIAACAFESGAVLVHKNPEFVTVPVQQEALPWKT